MTTPLERWQAVLNRELPDRVPTDFWSTPEVKERLLKELNCATDDELWRKLQIDKLHSVGPRYAGPERDHLWHLKHRTVSYADGAGTYDEVIYHPLAEASTIEDIDAFGWPSADWYDYSEIRQEVDRCHKAGWAVHVGHYEPYLLYCNLRGMENAFMDLVSEPELADAILDRIFGFHYALMARSLEAAGEGNIEVSYIAEDLGTQTGLLMSEALVDRFLKPKMKQMIELAHSFGSKAFHHSDGAVRPLIAGMIDIGIDLLNPIQWRCPGMALEGLKRDFGDKLVFHGAVDNQQTLPYGTVEDVIAEVKQNIEILGKDGGYVLAPCHNIQPLTTTEKIIAMYKTAREYGVY
ncbi:uroporphyrinogen-III decarboxylase-like protein [candidate division KSB1 bacterium]|nr:uroporphyrinogen-III decarboxylase-like protein [candidate division KSB1 bacterium]